MKLTFIIADTWSAYHRAQLGIAAACPQRTVSISLTPEQEQKVHLRKVGQSGSKPVYEDILEVFVDRAAEAAAKENT